MNVTTDLATRRARRPRRAALGLAVALLAPLLPVAAAQLQATAPSGVGAASTAPDLIDEARKVPPPASSPHGFSDVTVGSFFDQPPRG
jgi:hypothetical protein